MGMKGLFYWVGPDVRPRRLPPIRSTHSREHYRGSIDRPVVPSRPRDQDAARVRNQCEEHELTDAVLPEAAGIGPGQVRRAVEWLRSKGLLDVAGEATVSTVSLTESGVALAGIGATPEAALLLRAREEPAPTLKHLQADTRFDRGEWGSAFGGLKAEGTITQDGASIRIADPDRAAFYTERLVPGLFGRFKEAGDGAALNLDDFTEEMQSYIRERTSKRGKARPPSVWTNAWSARTGLRRPVWVRWSAFWRPG